MGKYVRKSKAADDVAAMEASSLGVRTRAKTLALQRMQQSVVSGGSYLQLRSRRLVKAPLPSPNFKTRASSRLRVSSSLVVESQLGEIGKESRSEKLKDCDEIGGDGVGVCEGFIGENSPDFHSRGTRESTPCSFIRDPDLAGTPGSSTKPSTAVEEFFAGAEQQQHRQFIEKYNFDPVNEKPFPGRYDWEKIVPPQEAPAPLISYKN